MTYDPTPATPATSSGADRAPPRQYISPAAVDLLQQTRPWVLTIAVLAFMGAGMLALGGVAVVGVGAVGTLIAPEASELGFPFALLGLLYLPLAALYFFGGRFLYRYAKSIQELGKSPSTSLLEDALLHQKSFWKLAALTIIGMFAVYGVAIVLAIVGSMFAAFLV